MARKFPRAEELELPCSNRGGTVRVFKHVQDFHRGVVSRDAADSSTAAGAGAADEDVWEFGFDTPCSGDFGRFGKGKSQCAMKNVAAEMAKFVFDVERSFRFEAGFAVMGSGEAIFDGFGEIVVQSVEAFSSGLLAGGFVV